jgi:hypothetical protein
VSDKLVSSFYTGFLDQLGKLVVGSGAVLGLAYVSGWIYSVFLYSFLNAPWVMDFIDPQGFIKEGLPLVLACTVVAVVSFFSFSDSDHMKGFGNSLLFVVSTVVLFSSFVMSLFGKNIESIGWVNALLALFFMFYSSSALGLAIKMIEEKKPRFKVLLVSALGLGSILFLFPFYMADQNARSLKSDVSGRSAVVDDKGNVVGVLVNAVSGKYLIADCANPSQMFFAETKSSLKVRPAKPRCT